MSREENAAIRAGLHVIICRMQDLRIGQKYAPHVIFPHAIHKFQKRKFDQEMAAMMFKLWQQISPRRNLARSKYRFNCFDVAAVAFAVRVGRNRKKRNAAMAELDKKLEMYRKRCKRSVEATLGKEQYAARQHRWIGFAQWIRYEALPLRVPKRPTGIREHHRKEFQVLLSLAKEVIQERCKANMDDAILERLVKLFKAELHRGRHEYKARTLINEPETAKAKIFEFIRKRVKLELKFEYMSFCEQQSALGDRMHAALNPLDANATLVTIAPAKVVDRIARIFREDIHPDNWEAVKQQVGVVATVPQRRPRNLRAETFEEVVQGFKPRLEPADRLDEINGAADWLINTLFAISASAPDVIALVEAGYGSAVQSNVG